MTEANNRIIIRTINRDTWTTVAWAVSGTDDYANDLADIDIDGDGNMYLRFHNHSDDQPFMLVLDKKGLRIYESEDLPPNMDERYGDTVAFDAEQYQPGQVMVPVSHLLQNAHGLLGDGNGQEWDDNPEYKRGIVELLSDVLGVPEEQRDEVVDRIRQAGA